MTEYELLDAAASFNSAAQSWIATYFTVVSAYIIAAYISGRDLTKSQSVIVSGAFIIFSGICAYGAAGSGARLMQIISEHNALTDRNDGMGPITLIITTSILLFGIVVSLKFMWDVRHPKAE